VKADVDQTEMTITYCPSLAIHLVSQMKHNPLGIDWQLAPQPQAQNDSR